MYLKNAIRIQFMSYLVKSMSLISDILIDNPEDHRLHELQNYVNNLMSLLEDN